MLPRREFLRKRDLRGLSHGRRKRLLRGRRIFALLSIGWRRRQTRITRITRIQRTSCLRGDWISIGLLRWVTRQALNLRRARANSTRALRPAWIWTVAWFRSRLFRTILTERR